MLSNRESARRSRHRKQAHVLEIEDKVMRIEAENESMKQALAKAADQETRSVEERTRLYTEIAALRSKVGSCRLSCTRSEPHVLHSCRTHQ